MKCRRCNGSGREPDPVEVGLAIRRARMKRGMTQTALADAVGASKGYVCDIEWGRRSTGGAKGRRLLAHLRLTEGA